MLDADSVFDRLLKEATNLIPKMSTPKLSAALNVSSALYQRINDILASRLSQEQTVVSTIPPKNFCVQGVQSIVGTPVISDEFVPESAFLSTGDPNFTGRTVASANYAAIPFFPQLNQFAMGQRGATLVTISGPNGSTTTGAVVGTIGPPTGQSGGGQQLIVPLQTAPPQLQSQQQQSNDPNAVLQQQTQTGKGDQAAVCDQTCATLITTAATQGNASTIAANGHIITATGMECGEIKPDLTPCLQRVGSNEDQHHHQQQQASTLYTVTQSNVTFLQPDATTAASNANSSASTSNPSNSTITTQNEISSGSANSSSGGPYQCTSCGKEFRVLRYLEKHKRIHTGEKPYQCCFCGRLFNDWPNMNRHKRIHTGERPYRCSECSKTFSQPAVYNEHVKRHTGERPYVCTVCSKGFPRAARLSVHMRVHTGEKPYRCNVCDRCFSQPHHVSTHIRIHSSNRSSRSSLRDGANSRRNRKQIGDKPTVSASDAVEKASDEVGSSVPKASSPSVQGNQTGVLPVSNDENDGDTSGDSAPHPDSAKHSQEGEIQVSTNGSPVEPTSLPTSTPVAMAASSTMTAAATDVSVSVVNSMPSNVGMVASENCYVQSHPAPHIFDANGTIYISAVDGTATLSTNGVSTTSGSSMTTTITSTLPQIQIHPSTTAAFSSDPHHHLQPRQGGGGGGSIQICYSANPNHNPSDSATIIMSPGGQKAQLFSPMLVPIGPASQFPYSSGAFQTLPPSDQQQQQQQTSGADRIIATPTSSAASSSSIAADA
ncbi:unnamed protein product [Hymenolepis diminuta]|uniref:C2H2-type domain-containing protein n=1 Tax=Hymenolepis diminuta TaxID=6216 RepID=A0A564Z2V8_HYMDI|nr:unnamed protein product [Hymenolepis diminuta]